MPRWSGRGTVAQLIFPYGFLCFAILLWTLVTFSSRAHPEPATDRNDGGGDRSAAAVESQGHAGCAKEGSMKSYFKKEAKFLLVWLLGFPLFLIAVALIAGSFITHRH